MSEPTPITLNTGNNSDDDGAVIDSFFVEVDNAPGLVPQDLVTTATETWPAIERILTSTFVIQPTWSPILVLPKDPHRMHITIRVVGFTGTDQVWFADDSGKMGLASMAFILTGVQPTLTIDDFTGPLYLAPNPANGAAITVSVMAVTK